MTRSLAWLNSLPHPVAFQRCSPFVNVWKDVSKRGKEKDDGYDMTNRKGSVDDADSWGEWDDDVKNQSNFAASRKGVVVRAPALPISTRIVAW